MFIKQPDSKQILEQVDGPVLSGVEGPVLSGVEGLLIDLDGVLYIGNQPVEGAAEAITRLKSKNIPIRFVTNTTTMSLDSIHKKLAAMRLPIDKSDIVTATQAAVLYLRELENPSCYLLLTDDPKKDFAEFPQSDTDPDYIIIGDIAKEWTYSLMNKIFNLVINGAKMIALHKGKFWQTEDGLRIDIGAFVAGLEYASGQTATVIGKPSRTFFELALRDLGVPANRAAMIGDDIDSDIGGTQAVGMKGILVKTGKYREELVKKSQVKPDYVVDSIAEM